MFEKKYGGEMNLLCLDFYTELCILDNGTQSFTQS